MVPFATLKRAALFTLSLAGCALQAAESAFSASFGEYSPGEALGEKGARGGTWRVAEGAMATNVVECARAAMDYKGAVSFAASSSCTGNVERVKLAVFVDALQKMDIFAQTIDKYVEALRQDADTYEQAESKAHQIGTTRKS